MILAQRLLHCMSSSSSVITLGNAPPQLCHRVRHIDDRMRQRSSSAPRPVAISTLRNDILVGSLYRVLEPRHLVRRCFCRGHFLCM
jgi:hypothetical protein